jgi:ABC-type branched-subunit amino acid transport system substrate-binding protein
MWARGKRRATIAVAMTALAALAAACSSSGGGGGVPGHAPLTYDVAIAFTGPDAPFGPETMAGCVPAVKLINAAGGVLGHMFRCSSTNTQGDPADAVPAINKMLATSSGVVGVLGPSSDEASAIVPILNAASIPMFPVTGQPSFDKSSYKYFWRTLPADDQLGYAMAAWGKLKGYSKAAAFFANSVGGQAQVPSLVSGYKHLGMLISPNLAIAEDQSSYRSEIEQIVGAHPQAIFTETDPQTGATFVSELHNIAAKSVPIVGDQVILEPSWIHAVGGSVGAAALKNNCVAIQPYAPPRGPGWSAYKGALLSSGSQVKNAPQYTADPYAMDPYDGAVIMALAMLQAHSVNPSVFNSHILDVTQPRSGAVTVHTFAQGKAALAAGHQIRYIGAMGPVDFNRYHNSTGAFDAVRCGVNETQPVGIITAAQAAAAQG